MNDFGCSNSLEIVDCVRRGCYASTFKWKWSIMFMRKYIQTYRCNMSMRHVFSRTVCQMIMIFGEWEGIYHPQIWRVLAQKKKKKKKKAN